MIMCAEISMYGSEKVEGAEQTVEICTVVWRSTEESAVINRRLQMTAMPMEGHEVCLIDKGERDCAPS